MLRKLAGLFRRKGVLVQGAALIEEGTARGVDVGDPLGDGLRVILCKLDGELYALDSRCPHAGGKIQTGPLEQGKYAVCPLHRYLFDPRTGRAEGVACPPARRFRTKVTGSDVEIFV